MRIDQLNLDIAKELRARGLPFSRSEEIKIRGEALVNWSGGLRVSRPAILSLRARPGGKKLRRNAIPQSAKRLAVIATVLHRAGVRMRPIARHSTNKPTRTPLHNWSPLHLIPEQGQDVVYVSFERLAGVLNLYTTGPRGVRVLCGTDFDRLCRGLHTRAMWGKAWLPDDPAPDGQSLTMPSLPAPGILSVGGALAIAAHGTRLDESDKLPWVGTVSGSLLTATILRWDEAGQQYIAELLDMKSPTFPFVAASLGRAFIVDVTLRVTTDYPLEMRLLKNTLPGLLDSAPEDGASLNRLLERSGLEVFAFRRRKNPGMVYYARWRRLPRTSTPLPWPAKNPLNAMVQVRKGLQEGIKLSMWRTASQIAEKRADRLEKKAPTSGPAAAQRLYVTSETLKVEPLGWALVLPRKDVQRAAQILYKSAIELAEQIKHSFALHHLAVELRFGDVNREQWGWAPILSAGAPVRRAGMVVMWINILSAQTRRTKKLRAPYLHQFEKTLLQLAKKEGWRARPEWSKGWGYAKDKGAWKASTARIRKMLEQGWPGGPKAKYSWRAACRIAWELDPHGVFSSPFHDRILPKPVARRRSR